MLVEPMLTRLRAASSLNAMLQVALRDVVALPGAEFGNIQMWGGSTELVVVAQSNASRKFRCSGARSPQQVATCCAQAARESRTVLMAGTELLQETDLSSARGCATFRSVVSLPLITAHGRKIGVVTAHFTNHYVPTALETDALESYCRQLADAIADKLLDGDIALTAKSLNQQVLATVH